MFASSGLDAGLLIGTEYVITQSQSCTLPATLIQVEDAAGFAGRSGDHAAKSRCGDARGARRFLTEPAPEGGAADLCDQAARHRLLAQLGEWPAGQRQSST